MSFGATTANRREEPKKVFGQEPDQSTSNQTAVPVPWFCGTKRLGVVWLDEIFNFTATPVYVKTKKKRQQSGWSYAVGVAFALCHGPIDRIHRILFDRVQVWPLNDNDSPENEDGSPVVSPLELTKPSLPEEIDIVGYGKLFLYRGTETQGIDADFCAATGHDHPAYRGVAWGWFERLELGEGRTTLPNIEIVSSRYPVPDWFSLSSSRVGTWGINPIAAIADFLQNPRVYLGWPDSRIDTDGLNEIAEDCARRCLGLSPYLTEAERGDAVITKFCEHIGAVPVILEDGRFSLKLIRATTSSAATLDESDLTEPPTLNPEGLADTVNQTTVSFTNADNWWREDSVAYMDEANYELTQELRPQTLARPWVNSAIMAQVVARTEGIIRALPQATGEASIRLSSLGTIRPGELFRLSYGHLGLCGLPVRCESVTYPGTDGTEARVSYHVDRAAGAALHVRPPDYEPPLTPTPALEPAEFVRIVPAWPGLVSDQSVPLSHVLAARTTVAVFSLRAHVKLEDDSYEDAGMNGTVARHGTLVAALPVTVTQSGEERFRIQLDGADLTLPTTTLVQAMRDTVLAFIGDEVLSLYDVDLVSAGLYECSAIRGRYGSPNEAHAAAADVFVLVNQEPFFVEMPDSGADREFKIQPLGRPREVPLADIDPVTAPGGLRSLRPLAPVGLRGDGQFHTVDVPTANDVVIAWANVPDAKAGGFWTREYDPLVETVLEFYEGTTLKHTTTVLNGLESFTYTAATRSTFGVTGPEVEVRAYQLRQGLRSERYDILVITLT